jgi:hypothetical protein
VTSAGGDILIEGNGGNGGSFNFGVWVRSAAQITASNSAKITIEGTGGNGISENNAVLFNGFGTTSATLVSAVDGDIHIIGHGNSSATGTVNRGVGIFEGSVIRSTGNAAIDIEGTGGSGTDAGRGVEISSLGTRVTSVVGDITITGQGGANTGTAGTFAMGVWISGDAVVESTGTGFDAATISIHGEAGAGSGWDIGVNASNNATITSSAGDISITGQGGAGPAALNYGYGLNVDTGAGIVSTGSAKITIQGTGATGGGDLNAGVVVNGVNSRIASVDGDISVNGQGGVGTGAFQFGVIVNSGGVIQATGNAAVTVQGTGGAGATGVWGSETVGQIGVVVDDTLASIAAVNGDLFITGAGGGTPVNQFNHGVLIRGTSDAIRSTGIGGINITGTPGFHGSSFGIRVADNGGVTTSGTGDVALYADRVSLDSLSTVDAGSRTVTIRQTTDGTLIGMGLFDTTGLLGLTDSELDRITAGTLEIGDTESGTITFISDITRSAPTDIILATDADEEMRSCLARTRWTPAAERFISPVELSKAPERSRVV